MLGGLPLDHRKQVWAIPFEMRVLEFPCLDALRLGMGAGEKIIDLVGASHALGRKSVSILRGGPKEGYAYFVKAIHVELANKTLPIVMLEVER